METLTEQRPSYEHVEATSDLYDLPNSYDQAPEDDHEQDPGASELQYVEGADGFYVYDTETGEAVLSMPLIISGEQQQTLQTVFADGIASIDVPTDFGTEDEEVWSLQTFSLSGETPDGRRIITLRAVMERRPKQQEEELPDQPDTYAALEQAAAITEARAAVEAAVLLQASSPTPEPVPVTAAEPAARLPSPEKVEVTLAAHTQIEPAGVVAERAYAPVSPPLSRSDTVIESKTSDAVAPLEATPVFEAPVTVSAPTVQPPIDTPAPERTVAMQPTPDTPVAMEATTDPPIEENAEPQTDSEPPVEAALPPMVEPLVEPESAVSISSEPSRFELPPVKNEPPKPPVVVRIIKAQALPPVQKIKSEPTEVRAEPKTDRKATPQKAPMAVLEAAQPPIEQAMPVLETIAAAAPVAAEIVPETSEEVYAQGQPTHRAERTFLSHLAAPLESPASPQVRASTERLSTSSWEQEASRGRLTSVLTTQTAATDSDDIVVSFDLPNSSRRTTKARAARSIAA